MFVTATLDGYSQIVSDGLAIQGVGIQPRHQSFKAGLLYFHSFVLFCSFCLVTLYVGVVFTRFSELREKLSGRKLTSKA